MRYEEIPTYSREQIERELSTDNVQRKTIALLSAALYCPDADWVEQRCVQFLRTEGIDLKYAGLVSLSHLVRIHRSLNLATILPLLDDIEADAELAGDVGTLREEIEIYMHGRRNY